MFHPDGLSASGPLVTHQRQLSHHVGHQQSSADLRLLAEEACFLRQRLSESKAFLQRPLKYPAGSRVPLGPSPDRQVLAGHVAGHDHFHKKQDAVLGW